MTGCACLTVVYTPTLHSQEAQYATVKTYAAASGGSGLTCTRTPGFVVLGFFCFTTLRASGAAAWVFGTMPADPTSGHFVLSVATLIIAAAALMNGA